MSIQAIKSSACDLEFSISNSEFVLKPELKGYQLSVNFFTNVGSLVSTKTFSFSQLVPEGGAAVVPLEKGLEAELLDVYSQNGVCGPDPLAIFSKTDEQGVKKAAAMMKSLKFNGPTILVLDLQEAETGYKLLSSIEKCERAVCAFFQAKEVDLAPKHARKIHDKFIPDFVLCEGRLKVDLLESGKFSAAEIEYFHTKEGAKSLCQFTEFFMNAFKLGEIVHGEKGALFASKYIIPITDRFSHFQPVVKSTVLYPASYKAIYSPEGTFAKVLSSVYSVSGVVDAPSKITVMSVEAKV